MYVSYEKRLGHIADFRVSYRYYTKEEGGRTNLPFQGLRSDVEFARPGGSIVPIDKIYMIWPEFEDTNGDLILDDTRPVPATGTARMWIIAAERRPIHRKMIQVGLTGYFWEGGRTAEFTVIELLGLMTNPIE